MPATVQPNDRLAMFSTAACNHGPCKRGKCARMGGWGIPDEMRCSSIMSSSATMQLCSSCRLSTRRLAAAVLGHKMDCASSWDAKVLTICNSCCPWLLVLSCETTCLLGAAEQKQHTDSRAVQAHAVHGHSEIYLKGVTAVERAYSRRSSLLAT
jgi:hypothetical protein